MIASIQKTLPLFIDGPNVDVVFGSSILRRKPLSHERPRWDRIVRVARGTYGVTEVHFVLNGDKFDDSRTPFYRFLRSIGCEVPTPKKAEWCKLDSDDPVDEYIRHHVRSLPKRIRLDEVDGVLLASHDGGYAPCLADLLDSGGFVGILGFREWFAPELIALKAKGATLIDLERDFGGFDGGLDRPDIAA